MLKAKLRDFFRELGLKEKSQIKRRTWQFKPKSSAIMLVTHKVIVLFAKEGVLGSGQKNALEKPAQDAVNN